VLDLSETVRFSVSIDNELLRKLDEVIKEKKCETRSRAVRDLIRDLIVEREWERSAGEVMGALTLLCSHDKRGITEKLLDIQHGRCSGIVSSMHLHLDEYNCMEMIAIKEMLQEVTEISDELISCKGVKHGKLIISSMGKEIA